MGYLSRKPNSNDPPRSREGLSLWLGDNDVLDETALLLSGSAKRCSDCGRATDIRYLDASNLCPDCR